MFHRRRKYPGRIEPGGPAGNRNRGTDGIPLTLGFSVAILIMLWTWAALNSWLRYQSIYEEARTEITGAQRVMQAHIGRTYQSVRNAFDEIDDWLEDLPENATRAKLDELTQKITRLQSGDQSPFLMRLIDNEGMVIWSIPNEFTDKPVNVSDRLYVKELRDKAPGATYFSEPLISRISGIRATPAAFRATPNVLNIGYITVLMPEEYYLEAFGQLTDIAPSKVGILRDDGAILFIKPRNESDDSLVIHGSTDVIARRPAGEAGLMRLPSLDGDGMAMVGYARLMNDPLAVFIAIKENDLRRVWLGEIVAPLLFTLLATLVIIAMAHRLIQQMRRNATEHKKLVAALHEAEAANIAKSNFLANMSHELRTPLNAIIGFAEVLEQQIFGPLGAAKYREYAGDIRKSGRHLLGIIGDILDTAKLNSGKIELGNEKLDLRDVLAGCLNMLSEESRRKQVSINLVLPATLPFIIMDGIHLTRIFVNLLGNALKFTPPGGTITVGATIKSDQSLEISVRDTGIGIPANRIRDLFKPFSQVEQSSARNHNGIGLGLVNTELIITAYGGRVWLESEVDVGTNAVFVIPANRLEAVQKMVAAS